MERGDRLDGIMNWMKEFLIVYLLLTILTNLVAVDRYKKHLHFFSGVVLLFVFLAPVLGVFGKAGKLESLISYEAFWEKLDSAKQDMEKLEFLQNSQTVAKYEQAVALNIQQQAQENDMPVRQVRVRLTDSYEIRQVSVWMDLSQDVGKEARERLLRFLQKAYNLKKEQVLLY